jgi:hypothetical protein
VYIIPARSCFPPELLLEAGMDAYPAKPFQVQQLMNMVNRFAHGTPATAPDLDQKPSQT